MRGSLALALALAVVFASEGAGAFVWPNVPEQVERALASSDVGERRRGAQRLVELPEEVGAALVGRVLADPDVDVRLRGAQAAARWRLSKAADTVVAWLGEGDARLRLAACEVIRAAPTPRAAAALGRVLGDPDAKVRLTAASAMGAAGSKDGVSPLLGHLDDPSPEVRAEVARALGRIGETAAVMPLLGKVQDTVPDVRRAVARALGNLGDRRAASALVLALQDASHEVRAEAARSLGRLRAPEAVLGLAPLLDADPTSAGAPSPSGGGRPQFVGTGAVEVRLAAITALGLIADDAAVVTLIGALARDDPAAARSPVRSALVAAGPRAVDALVALVRRAPSERAAAGGAIALGELVSEEAATAAAARTAVDTIVRSMQSGALTLRSGLVALASAKDAAALPAVLELLDDQDAAVRREALRTAEALLDPARPDGRAVEPVSALLADARTPIDERVGLVRVLGRTGSPRAQQALLPLARANITSLRMAVLEAMGTLGPAAGTAASDAALLAALEDESAEVRRTAALSLAEAGTPAVASRLLDRLTASAEQDRAALGIALAGAMERATDASLAARVGRAVASAPESARDALIEGLGRMRSPAAAAALGRLASGGIDDRRKVAEALAGHADSSALTIRLAADADPAVRAAAAWSLGTIGGQASSAILVGLLADKDATVAGNAAGALGRLASDEAVRAQKESVVSALCASASDRRPYVRANSIVALSAHGAACKDHPVRDVLARDRSEAVRLAAALALHRAVARGGADVAADARALARCASEERTGSVAARCVRPGATPGATDDVVVLVVPEGETAPKPRAPFALVRPDGLMRLGTADRRGAVFERAVPRGTIRLAVPAALAR